MKNTVIASLVVFSALIFSGCTFPFGQQTTSSSQTSQDTQKNQTATFQTPKKSAHYESNTPEHGSTLAGVPTNIVINFNFDLAKPSEIKIEKDGKDYGQGETTIDTNKLALRRGIDPASPDGLYSIKYNACWPDGSCHDGNFQFIIDKTQAENYKDMTQQKEITIDMKNIVFVPQNIKISKGTKVTWTNNDNTTHYVNTDSHPAHTYLQSQNSKALENGDKYTLAFDTAGIYPYHCSAHADTMTGNILVQ